jgi:hypothetical protein
MFSMQISLLLFPVNCETTVFTKDIFVYLVSKRRVKNDRD